MSEIKMDFLLGNWPISGVQSIERLTSGANNYNWAIHTHKGDYVLRVYRNVDAPAGIACEHALLHALAATPLPFDVPVPVQTRTGATTAETREGPAVLAKRIPGRHPRAGDLADTRAAGAALGQLSKALASLRIDCHFPASSGQGDLWNVHSAVAGPAEILALLTTEGPERANYERAVELTESAWPGFVATLPTQLIHADYDATNVLLNGGTVSGVLDFEFSRPGLRAMDLAIGLWHFCLRSRIRAVDALVSALLRDFLSGFSECVILSRAEFEALPALLVRRQLVVMLHWFGRWKTGLSSEQDVMGRLLRLGELQQWLDRGGREVLAGLSERRGR